MFSKRIFGFPSGAAFFLILASSIVWSQDFSQPDSEPSPQAPLIQKANDALSSGDYQTALKILTQLKLQTPNNPQILYDLGLTREALQSGSANTELPPVAAGGDTPESSYRAAIAADPKFAAPHVALGLLLARTGQPTAARTELAAAVALPEIEPALKSRALRALARLDVSGNPSEASSELLEALKLSPEEPSDVLLSAQIAEASKDFPAAEQAYRRYLATKSGGTDGQATSGLAHALLAEHHSEDAVAVLQQGLKQHPGDPALTAQLAEAYLDSGDRAQEAQATPLLENLHAAHPQDANITRLLARVYSETGHPSQSEPLYASLISAAAGKPDPTLLSDSADALIRLRRPAEAEKLLKQAVADRNGFPTPEAFGDAALHLAFAASEIDDPNTTLQALALRATVQPPSPSALFLEATANDALHQSSKAIELYKSFLASAAGGYPEQEAQARRRVIELQHTK